MMYELFSIQKSWSLIFLSNVHVLRRFKFTFNLIPILWHISKIYLLLNIYNKGQVCDPNPCTNNGICCPSERGTYSCKCPLGYEGVRCEFSKFL